MAGPHGVEVTLDTRHGGTTRQPCRLLAHWIADRENCLAEEPADLVLCEVLDGGRVAVRTFFPNSAGVLMRLGATLLVDAQDETDRAMADALGYAPKARAEVF